MSCTRRSLSSTASPFPLEESRPNHTMPEDISVDTQNTSADLEDGEIADETRLGEAEAVDGLGEVVDRREPSLKHMSRLDVELSESLGREHEDTIVPKPSISDMETLESLGSSGEHSGADSHSHSISTIASAPKPDVPIANCLHSLKKNLKSRKMLYWTYWGGVCSRSTL